MIKVSNNQSESRFEASVDGALAVAEYERQPGKIVFTHTEVPEQLGGRGIAQELVKAGLDYARAEKLQVVALCSYVAKFIERHPEYQDLVAGSV